MSTTAHSNSKPQKIPPKTAAKAEPVPAPAPSKPKKEKVSPVHRQSVAIARATRRIEGRRKAIARWSDAGGHTGDVTAELDAALIHLNKAAEKLNAIPADWKHKAEKASKSETSEQLAEGQLVAIRDKYRKEYDLVLQPGEMDEIIVKAHRGDKVVCRAPNGDTIVLRRRELERKDTK